MNYSAQLSPLQTGGGGGVIFAAREARKYHEDRCAPAFNPVTLKKGIDVQLNPRDRAVGGALDELPKQAWPVASPYLVTVHVLTLLVVSSRGRHLKCWSVTNLTHVGGLPRRLPAPESCARGALAPPPPLRPFQAVVGGGVERAVVGVADAGGSQATRDTVPARRGVGRSSGEGPSQHRPGAPAGIFAPRAQGVGHKPSTKFFAAPGGHRIPTPRKKRVREAGSGGPR